MRYKIKKETKPTLPTFGKYKAVAVHNQVVDSRVIAKEACDDDFRLSRHAPIADGRQSASCGYRTAETRD